MAKVKTAALNLYGRLKQGASATSSESIKD